MRDESTIRLSAEIKRGSTALFCCETLIATILNRL